MRRCFWMLAVSAFCILTFDATAQVTKGLHFYMPFNEGKGKVAKDVGPNGFEAELHDSAKFVAKGKVGSAIEFSEGPALIELTVNFRNSLPKVRWGVQSNFRRVPR